MSNKLLLGGFLTSFAYLSFKLYERIAPQSLPSQQLDDNYFILERMKEKFNSGHLKTAPFPAQLELTGQLKEVKTADKPASLCESIQNQMKRDWNCFLYRASKVLLQ